MSNVDNISFFKVRRKILRKCFFPLQSFNGTDQILLFGTKNVFLKNVSLNVLDPPQVVFLIMIIIRE